jgi:two-component system, chemotaxis family, protein-glutamate methylesterase/glutaminase
MKSIRKDSTICSGHAVGLFEQREVSVTVEGEGEKGAGKVGPDQSPPRGFTGTVSLQLTDLLQMICLSRGDLVVRVTSVEGSGTIHVRAGQIHHAHTETLEGETAFFEILRWQDGQFEMLPYQDADKDTVNKPWEHLILEAMRQRDEGAAKAASDASSAGDDCDDVEELDECAALEEELDFVFDKLEFIAQDLDNSRPAEAPEAFAVPAATKVLIVDDSSFFARQLQRMLEADPDIEVVGVAKNGQDALLFLATKPAVDVITLDINMPVMQGDTALKHIMIRHPIPVLILSSFQPQSLPKIFEFLQVGAIDFFSKPETHEDVTMYGKRLRDTVKRTAQAQVSHFKRWRKSKIDPAALVAQDEPDGSRVLLILGAEGAYMDWFRLPLASLANKGLVIGLQKLFDPFLARFCQLLEEGTGAKTEPLVRSMYVKAGSFYFGNAGQRVALSMVPEGKSLGVEVPSSKELVWHNGVLLWLEQLAAQAGERLSVYCLSAAHPLPADMVELLLRCNAKLIVPPQDMVMCTALLESVSSYAPLYPKQVFWASPESLMEVWLRNERSN